MYMYVTNFTEGQTERLNGAYLGHNWKGGDGVRLGKYRRSSWTNKILLLALHQFKELQT